MRIWVPFLGFGQFFIFEFDTHVGCANSPQLSEKKKTYQILLFFCYPLTYDTNNNKMPKIFYHHLYGSMYFLTSDFKRILHSYRVFFFCWPFLYSDSEYWPFYGYWIFSQMKRLVAEPIKIHDNLVSYYTVLLGSVKSVMNFHDTTVPSKKKTPKMTLNI